MHNKNGRATGTLGHVSTDQRHGRFISIPHTALFVHSQQPSTNTGGNLDNC